MTASNQRPGWPDRLRSHLRALARWHRLPARYRRRQLLLGNVLAFFAALFLAIALRGRAVTLLILVTGLLVVHLVIADQVGRRIRRRRSRRARVAASRLAEKQAIAHLQPAITSDDLARAMRLAPPSHQELGVFETPGCSAENIAVAMAAELRRAKWAMDNEPSAARKVQHKLNQATGAPPSGFAAEHGPERAAESKQASGE